MQAHCKEALQKELGLPVRPDCPMVRASYIFSFIWMSGHVLNLFSWICFILLYYLLLLLFAQIGFIGRLDYQKGTDLIKMAVPELMREDVQFVSYILISLVNLTT